MKKVLILFSILILLFVGFGMGREQAFGFGKDIVTLANDLDSFNNLSAKGIDVQKNMVSALMGESDAAKAFGVSILEPQLAVASLALGLGKYSNKMENIRFLKYLFRQKGDVLNY